jgi:hypothetical protein
MAKLHYVNKLANLLCNITNELNLLGACLARAQQVGSVEFISQQVVQQVGNLLVNLFVWWSLAIKQLYDGRNDASSKLRSDV